LSRMGTLAPKLFCFVLFLSFCYAGQSRKVVSVELYSKWETTPFTLEASEFFAAENKKLFWKFVDFIAEKNLSTSTDEEEYNLVLEAAGDMLPLERLPLLKYALQIRHYSPTVEMHRQYCQQVVQKYSVKCTGENWVQIGEKVFCTLSDLKQVDFSSVSGSVTLLDSDHIHPNVGISAGTRVVLYGRMGSEGFNELHQYLSSEVEKGDIVYVLRHNFRRVGRTPLPLQGYGVSLSFKSMEYKVIDDSKVEGKEHTLDEIDQEEELEGFFFSKLKERRPELHSELETFRDHLTLNRQAKKMKTLRSLKLGKFKTSV